MIDTENGRYHEEVMLRIKARWMGFGQYEDMTNNKIPMSLIKKRDYSVSVYYPPA